MMKLRHLFDNPELAVTLLGNWDYEASSLELFRYYRISANAIYPFRQNGGTCFLRFCPVTEKSEGSIQAELEFIHYLRRAGYEAMEPVPALAGEELLRRSTPWGEYFASVFRRVPGEQVSELGYEDEVVFALGASLGGLHRLSAQYHPAHAKRWSHADVLDWIEAELSKLQAQGPALQELQLLRVFFSRLPADPGNYGLVHYDFEPDNVFYDAESQRCGVIDFDDAMYHWYVMDLQQALDSMESEIPPAEFARKQDLFLGGYGTWYEIDSGLFAAMPAFGRFANLYRYARISRCVQERWENEPAWLLELRARLEKALAACQDRFGKPL